MPAWLAPIAGKLGLGVLFLLAGLLAVWMIRRSGKREARLDAEAESAELRGEASKAGMEGYLREKEKLEGKSGGDPPPGGDRMRGRKDPGGQA